MNSRMLGYISVVVIGVLFAVMGLNNSMGNWTSSIVLVLLGVIFIIAAAQKIRAAGREGKK